MSNALEVRPLADTEFDIWNRLVDEAPEGTVYHDSRWLGAISDAVRDRLAIMGFFLDGRLVGGLPLQVRRRGPLALARRAFATPYADPVVSVEAATEVGHQVCAAVERLVRRFSCVVVTGSPFSRPVPWPPPWRVAKRATYVVNIENVDGLWREFGRPLQKKLRRTRQQGIRIGTDDAPEAFFDLYMGTFSRQGLKPPFTRERFQTLIKKVTEGGFGNVYVAVTAEGLPCAARLVLYDRKRAYCALSGFDPDVTKARTSEFLIWEIMRDMSKTHLQLDLVGANIAGITEFKRKFRGRRMEYTEAVRYRSLPERLLIRLYQRGARSRSETSHG